MFFWLDNPLQDLENKPQNVYIYRFQFLHRLLKQKKNKFSFKRNRKTHLHIPIFTRISVWEILPT